MRWHDMAEELATLLEREDALAQLDAALDDARSSRGSVVLVSGEAGIGKSSVVRAWTRAIEDAQLHVGWCDDLRVKRALGPFHDIARRGDEALAAAVAAADTDGVLDAMLRLLDNPLRPVVVAVEDLHWADDATLDVLRLLARRIDGLPTVLVLTHRDELADDHPLGAFLGSLATVPTHRLRLAPLSTAAVARLLGDDPRDASGVRAVTNGNPFFVSELARTDSDRVPVTVSDAVLARLRALPDDSQAALELLAVVPGAVDVGLATRLLGDVAVLAEAERRGLLRVDTKGIRFRHELARRAIEGALTSVQRVSAHARVLDGMLADEATLDRVAMLHHARFALADAAVAEHGPAAVAEAHRAGSYREAVELGEEVRRVAHLVPDDVLAALLVDHGWALHHLHRDAEAVEAAHAAVVANTGRDDGGTVRALLALARAAFLNKDRAEALEALARATSLVADSTDAELAATVAVDRAALLWVTGDAETARAAAPGAIAAADAVGRLDLAVLARSYDGHLRAVGGAVDDGITCMQDAIVRGVEGGALEAVARAYVNLAELLVWEGRLDEAERWVDAGIGHCHDHDFVGPGINLACFRAQIDIERGRWEAVTAAMAEVGTDRRVPSRRQQLVLETEARLAVWRGDDAAERLVDETWTVARGGGRDPFAASSAIVRLEFALFNDRPDVALGVQELVSPSTTGPNRLGQIARLSRLLGVDGAPADPRSTDEPLRSSLSGAWETAADGWRTRGAELSRILELGASGDRTAMLEAHAAATALGARGVERWLRRQLRDAGVRAIPRGPNTATRTNPGGLTNRQLEVLELVAEGLTNAQIADRLILSPRTVDQHVSAILQKLGVASRHDAVAAAGLGD
jgi:DNA-binding CsgD family transcriptional regulator/tetratricopeptide (TPR) repeat protein